MNNTSGISHKKDLDAQSSGSYFFNDDDLQNYEQHIQQQINDIWNDCQKKQEQLQNNFQVELEEIIEECAGIKYEKMSDIKLLYKNCSEDQIPAKERELAQVKIDMEELKKKKVEEAKEVLQGKLKALG